MILVTGGTGFLGSRLLRQLVNAGKEVRCIYRKRILQNVPLEAARYIDWQEADLLDVISLENSLDGIEQVFHCAGMVSFNPDGKKEMQAINVTGTANLVNACIAKKVKKLVHVSSVAALGRSVSGKIIDETIRWEDSSHNTPYACSKHDGEIEVWRGIGEGLNAVIVNPSVLIGSSPGWTDESARLIKNIYNGFPWYTKGVNGFVNVEDVAKAMTELMEGDITSERFILNGDNWSYQQLFSTINRCLGKETVQKYASPLLGEIIWRVEKIKSLFTKKRPLITHDIARTASLKVYYDNSKIKRYLPQLKFTPLDKTIAGTCKAYLQYVAQQKNNNLSEKVTSNSGQSN